MRPQFQRAIHDLVSKFPAGRYRVITLDLVAACIAFLKASFTFVVSAGEEARSIDNIKYGKWDTDIYTAAYIADIKEWLLDEDAVATEWDVLIRLRRMHNGGA